MILLSKSRWLWMAIFAILLAVASATAQGSFVVYESKTSTLHVGDIQGNTYIWTIYKDHSLTSEANLSEVEFIRGNTGATVTIHWKKRGDYFFVVRAFGPTGCTNMKVGKIRVIPIVIEAVAGQNQTIGACQSVILDASQSIGTITSYKWSVIGPYGILSHPGEKTTEVSLSPSYSGPLPVNLKVKLLVTDKQGNSDLDTVVVTIDQLPVADVYISGKLEKDGSMLIDGTVSKGTSIQYRWFTDEGKIIGDNQGSVIAVNGAGIYSLEITDAHGCKSLKSFRFPLKSTVLIANKDYGRIYWTHELIIPILDNDFDSDNDIDPSTVKIKENPANGIVIINKDGTISYRTILDKPGDDQFIYEVCDSLGTCDSALVVIDIYDAGLTVPEAFSPNGDGQNETLIFRGLENYPKSRLYVYTRSGVGVYHSLDYFNDWDGKRIDNGQILPTGTYYYVLELGGTNRVIKGFVFINY